MSRRLCISVVNTIAEITELAEAIADRRIDIAGDIDLSLYPWVGIKAAR